AEDGIRDRNVTGVQTCALPICRAEPELEVSAAVNLHCFCPNLYKIGSCCRFIVQNVDFCPLWMYHDRHKTAISGEVKGQKIQRVDRKRGVWGRRVVQGGTQGDQ